MVRVVFHESLVIDFPTVKNKWTLYTCLSNTKLKSLDNKFGNKNYAKLCKRINKDVTTA